MRYFYANRERLQAEGVDVDEWTRKTDASKLPEKAGLTSRCLPEKASAAYTFVAADPKAVPNALPLKREVKVRAALLQAGEKPPDVLRKEPWNTRVQPEDVALAPTRQYKKGGAFEIDWEAHKSWGGRSATPAGRRLIRMWERKDPDGLYAAIRQGMKVETEHDKHDVNKQVFTTLDHLVEGKNYYPLLAEMEKELKPVELKTADLNRVLPAALIGSALGAGIGGFGSLLMKKDKETAIRNALIGGGAGALLGGGVGAALPGKAVSAATLRGPTAPARAPRTEGPLPEGPGEAGAEGIGHQPGQATQQSINSIPRFMADLDLRAEIPEDTASFRQPSGHTAEEVHRIFYPTTLSPEEAAAARAGSVPTTATSVPDEVPADHLVGWEGHQGPAPRPSFHEDALGSIYAISTPGRHEMRAHGRLDMPRMSLTRGTQYQFHVDGLGEVNGTALGVDQNTGLIHLQTGNRILQIRPADIMGGIEKRSEVYPTAQVTAQDAPLRGDEVHIPLVSNPFNTPGQQPDDAVDYENGYQFAQEAGAQGLSGVQPEQMAQWAGRSVSWRKGFAEGLRKMGRGDLADMLENTISEGHPMKEAVKAATFARAQLGSLAGTLIPLAAGTAVGAGLGHMIPMDSIAPEVIGGGLGAAASLPFAQAGSQLGAGLGFLSGMRLPEPDYGKDEQGRPIQFQAMMPAEQQGATPIPTGMPAEPKFAGVFHFDGQNLTRVDPATGAPAKASLLANPAMGPGDVKAKFVAARAKAKSPEAPQTIHPDSAFFTNINRVQHKAG